MIALKKLNKTEFILNADLIESIEATPDTRIKLESGKSYIVLNSISEIIKKIVKYKQLCNNTISVVNRREDI